MATPPPDDADTLVFAAEAAAPAPPAAEAWRVLIVDDEPEVHDVTRLALADFEFRGRTLRLESALSAREARTLLAERPGVCVILLDVVMETDHAGLDLVRDIRTTLGDRFVRIILRTGQPGLAPERAVIVEYDINDYKEKSELTAPRLFTAMVAAIRAYEDLVTLEAHRQGLRRIIDASAALFQPDSLDAFFHRVLEAFDAVFRPGADLLLCVRHGAAGDGAVHIAAGSGGFAASVGHDLDALARPDVRAAVRAALAAGDGRDLSAERSAGRADGRTVVFRSHNHHEAVLYVDRGPGADGFDEQMLAIFCTEAGIGLDNAYLYDQLRRSEAATVLALAKAAEFKDEGTSSHLRRVAALSQALARVLHEDGLFPKVIDATFLRLIGLASVLHDVGKVGVPDSVLHKHGPLNAAEWEVMHRHPLMSEAILRDAARMVDGATYLSLGAELAAAHHERYDGKGYPRHLAGEQIPVAARIMAIVDVFDALTTERVYKPAWSVDQALAFLRAEAGRRFDPVMTEAFVRAIASGRIRPEIEASATDDPLAAALPRGEGAPAPSTVRR